MIAHSLLFGVGGGIFAGLVHVGIISNTHSTKRAKNRLDKFRKDPVYQLAKSNPVILFILMSAPPFFVISLTREEPILRENVIATNPIGECILNYTIPFIYALVLTIWVRHHLTRIETNEANQSSKPT